MNIPRPEMAGDEKFKVMLESTLSPFVYQAELQKKVEAELMRARAQITLLNSKADAAQERQQDAQEAQDHWQRVFDDSEHMDDQAETERSNARRHVASLRGDVGKCRQAAHGWDVYVETLEAAYANFKDQLSAAITAAQSAAVGQAGNPA